MSVRLSQCSVTRETMKPENTKAELSGLDGQVGKDDLVL